LYIVYKYVSMSTDQYRRALDAAVREYEKLLAEHATLEGRLAQLKHSIAALTKLCGYEPTVPMGLTDACRLVLRNANQPLTALEVRDRLTSIGVDLEKHSNPLASIHTVLKRLHGAGELVERDRDDEPSARTAYVFALPVHGVTGVGTSKRRITGEGLCPPKDRKK
jgi:hypothetical protein